jgi:SOS-response transcriptional repressor LexA
MNFSENIKVVLDYFDTSPSGLEKILDLSNGYIANLEKKGTDNPGKLLVALNEKGVSADWFLTGKGEMLLQPSAETGREIVKDNEGFKVPLLRQKVSCGPGVDWQDENNIVDYIDVFDMIPRLKSKRLFALCVEGSSMLGAGIRNGDYVLFDSAEDQWLHDGIYVFALDGEVYCKRLEFDGISKKIKIYSVRVSDLEKVELLATIDTKDASTADRLTIFGRVLYWVHPNLDDD